MARCGFLVALMKCGRFNIHMLLSAIPIGFFRWAKSRIVHWKGLANCLSTIDKADAILFHLESWCALAGMKVMLEKRKIVTRKFEVAYCICLITVFLINCCLDLMESVSKPSLPRNFHISLSIPWDPIANLLLLPAMIIFGLKVLDWKLRFLIITVENGCQPPTTPFQMVIGNFLWKNLLLSPVILNSHGSSWQ